MRFQQKLSPDHSYDTCNADKSDDREKKLGTVYIDFLRMKGPDPCALLESRQSALVQT